MNHDELSLIVNNIANRVENAPSLAYFDCVEMLDALEFHVLDMMNRNDTDLEFLKIQEQASQLHEALTSILQTIIDKLIKAFHSSHAVPPMLQQIIAEYHNSSSNKLKVDEVGYDSFDDFLIHLFQVDFEPSETRSRTEEMVYLQPLPGRIILEMIQTLSLNEFDYFYDFGSGLGQVPILVSLLTPAHVIGIEYEPTYVNYSKLCAKKLEITDVEFRNQDVRDSDFRDGTIFFMHTPFMGSILRQVLDSLHQLSKKHCIKLCTYGPCTSIISQEKWLYSIDGHAESHRLAIFSSYQPQE